MQLQTIVAAMCAGITLSANGCGVSRLPGLSRAELSRQPEALQAMRARGADASLVVFPVYMEHGTSAVPDVGDVLALLLEQNAGMTKIGVNHAEFDRPADATFDAAAERFGTFVRTHPIDADYALYAEFAGTPKTGPSEIRFVVVDRAGTRVWLDRQGPEDRDFQRLKPDCPMTCCNLIAERLRVQMGLPPAAGDRSEGPMARMFAQKSGLPSEAERTAMEERQARLHEAAPRATMAVYPVLVRGETSADAARGLAVLIAKAGLCKPVAVAEGPRFQLEAGPNQQRRLWDLARAARNHLKKAPANAEYALFAEYMIAPGDEGGVVAVNFVVCDRNGAWVVSDFQNSHQGDFTSVDPKTAEDCNRLVVRRLRHHLQ